MHSYLTPKARVVTLDQILTPLKEAFCVEYVMAGCSGLAKALERAMLALDPVAYTKNPQTLSALQQKAYKMMRDPAVQQRVDEIRLQAAQDARYTLMDHLTRLGHISNLAEATGELKVALAAELARGKAAGYQRNDPASPNGNTQAPYYNPSGAEAPMIDPTTGKAPASTHIQNAIIMQNMTAQEASDVYKNLLSGRPMPALNPALYPTIVTTIPNPTPTPAYPENILELVIE